MYTRNGGGVVILYWRQYGIVKRSAARDAECEWTTVVRTENEQTESEWKKEKKEREIKRARASLCVNVLQRYNVCCGACEASASAAVETAATALSATEPSSRRSGGGGLTSACRCVSDAVSGPCTGRSRHGRSSVTRPRPPHRVRRPRGSGGVNGRVAAAGRSLWRRASATTAAVAPRSPSSSW